MNENEIVVTLVAEESSRFNCGYCALGNTSCVNFRCEAEHREDGRNVIFKIKETK